MTHTADIMTKSMDLDNLQCSSSFLVILLFIIVTMVAFVAGACATYFLFPRRVTVTRTLRIWPDSVTLSRTGDSYHKASTCAHLRYRAGVRTFTRCPDCEDVGPFASWLDNLVELNRMDRWSLDGSFVAHRKR